MADYYLDGQKPNYRSTDGTKVITLDPSLNKITITDSNIPKTITIDSTEFSNGTQNLPYTQLYETVNACASAVYPATASTLTVNNIVKVQDTGATSAGTITATGGNVSVACSTGDLLLQTKNTNQNLTHYLSFVDNTSGAPTIIQKTNGISCNPSTNTITCEYTSLGKGVVNSDTTNKNYVWTDRTTRPTGADDVLIGYRAGNVLATGGQSVMIGTDAGRQASSANNNVYIGNQVAEGTNSSNNTFVGYRSNQVNVAGSNNTAIGALSSCATFQTSTAIGYGATCTANNQIRLGTATENVSCPGTLSLKLVDDNTNTTCYIPFAKTTAGTEGQLFVDSATGPLTYNPSQATLNCGSFVTTAGNFNRDQITANGGLYNSTTTGQINIGGSQTSGALVLGGSNTTGNIVIGNSLNWQGGNINIGHNTWGAFGSLTTNIMSAVHTNTGTINLMNGAFSGSSNVNILCGNFTASGGLNLMTGSPTTTGTITMGGSTNVTLNFNSGSVFSKNISTSITTAPSTTRHLGYTTSKTTGWSNITNTASNINSITIDGTTIGFGVYRLDLLVNFTNDANDQTFQISISSTTGTLSAPCANVYTPASKDNGVTLSYTISAYASTTFYIVGKGSVAGATILTASPDTSTIYLTRIG